MLVKDDFDSIRVIKGRLSFLKTKGATAAIFFGGSDEIGMAATSVLASASGLGGIAAGMALMSTDEWHEPVVEANFVVNGQLVRALLWSFPFSEGDDVEAVGEYLGDEFVAYAVLSPSQRLIALYPHVSAGSKAHLRSVLKTVALASSGITIGIFFLLLAMTAFIAHDADWLGFIGMLAASGFAFGVILFIIGLRIGNRFRPFVKMADRIFLALGWPDAKQINLRRISREKRLPGDPVELGDRYFRY